MSLEKAKSERDQLKQQSKDLDLFLDELDSAELIDPDEDVKLELEVKLVGFPKPMMDAIHLD